MLATIRKCGVTSPGLPAKEGMTAKTQSAVEHKNLASGVIISEEFIPGYSESPHSFLDPYFYPIRGVHK
jgi:hypothetical protein